MIKVLLADDHQVMIDGLRALLANEADIEIVAEANNGKEVLNRLNKIEIDVVVLDISMPEMDGNETLLEIQEKFTNTKVLILSLYKDETTISNFLNNGILGYVIKDRGSNEIVSAIRTVAKGEEYFDKEVEKIIRNIAKNKKTKPLQKEIKFSGTEKAVLDLLADNMSSKAIASTLNMSPHTVESHKRNAAAKLEIRIAELKTYAIQLKYKNNSTNDKT